MIGDADFEARLVRVSTAFVVSVAVAAVYAGWHVLAFVRKVRR